MSQRRSCGIRPERMYEMRAYIQSNGQDIGLEQPSPLGRRRRPRERASGWYWPVRLGHPTGVIDCFPEWLVTTPGQLEQGLGEVLFGEEPVRPKRRPGGPLRHLALARPSSGS